MRRRNLTALRTKGKGGPPGAAPKFDGEKTFFIMLVFGVVIILKEQTVCHPALYDALYDASASLSDPRDAAS